MKRYLFILLALLGLVILLAIAYAYFQPYWQEKPCCTPQPPPQPWQQPGTGLPGDDTSLFYSDAEGTWTPTFDDGTTLAGRYVTLYQVNDAAEGVCHPHTRIVTAKIYHAHPRFGFLPHFDDSYFAVPCAIHSDRLIPDIHSSLGQKETYRTLQEKFVRAKTLFII